MRLRLGGMVHGHVFTGRSVGRQGAFFVVVVVGCSVPLLFPWFFSRVFVCCRAFFPDWVGFAYCYCLRSFHRLPTTAPSDLLIKLPGNDASPCVCLRCWPQVPWLFAAIGFVGLTQAGLERGWLSLPMAW